MFCQILRGRQPSIVSGPGCERNTGEREYPQGEENRCQPCVWCCRAGGKRGGAELKARRGLLATTKSRFFATLSRNNMSKSTYFWYIGDSGQRLLWVLCMTCHPERSEGSAFLRG